MAMRPRGGGGGSSTNRRTARFGGIVRPVYEDFRPESDWKQDDESHILSISLPGFMKEQIRVSTEGQNTLRVRGERLVAGNKWSRFLEDFQLPDNGEINSVRAKFQGGILTITIPKKEIRKPQQDTSDTQKQPSPPQKPQDRVLPEATNPVQRTDEKSSKPKETSTDQKQPSPESKGQEKTLPPAIGTSQFSENEEDDDEKSLLPHQETSRNEHGVRDQNGKNVTPLKFPEKKGDNEYKEKNNAPETSASDHVREKRVDQRAEREKEIPEVQSKMKAVMERYEATNIPEKKGDSKELYGAFAKEKYKKAVKGLAELDEERRLLVNMGVAVLVIVALTAYATYKFASAKNEK